MLASPQFSLSSRFLLLPALSPFSAPAHPAFPLVLRVLCPCLSIIRNILHAQGKLVLQVLEAFTEVLVTTSKGRHRRRSRLQGFPGQPELDRSRNGLQQEVPILQMLVQVRQACIYRKAHTRFMEVCMNIRVYMYVCTYGYTSFSTIYAYTSFYKENVPQYFSTVRKDLQRKKSIT